MKTLLRPLLASLALIATAAPPALAEANYNHVGRALISALSDAHYEVLRFNENINQRILARYLDNLDPEKLYFTQADVADFAGKYTGPTDTPFDILLFRSRGMEPAQEIYRRFAQRVGERTEFIEQAADNAAFDFTADTLVPLSRENAFWPEDSFAAQRAWGLKIANEILTEQLLQEQVAKRLQEKKPTAPADEGEAQPLQPEPEKSENGEESEAEKTLKELLPVNLTPAVPPRENAPLAPTAPDLVPPAWQRDSPRKIVKARYQRFHETVQAASEEKIADYFFSAVAQAYDPHSDYLSVAENERFDRELQNQLTGIGAELSANPDGSTRIGGLIVNGPAHRQGELQPNDRIVAVDPLNDGRIIDITHLPTNEVVELILGRRDTQVGLLVENRTPEDPAKRKVVITRDTVELKNAAASAMLVKVKREDNDPLTLGWITIPSFYLDFEDGDPSVYKDVRRLLTRMKAEKVDGIALDLRGNGGGSLTEVPRLAGLFLPRGPIVQARNRARSVETYASTPLTPLYDGPLVALTDRESASSSEILVGALQDYNRAILVGESSTFGKGTVQEKMGIAEYLRFMQDPTRAGELKTTVQKFYRVTGSSTQLRGVVPDIIFPSLNDLHEIGERYLPYALPHDIIPPVRNFQPLDRAKLHLPQVAENSRLRVQENPEFAYLREDLIREEVKRQRNVTTLNREKRLQEQEEELARLAQRNRERHERFVRLEKEDRETFQFLRLTLDDVDRPVLPHVNEERDSQNYIIRSEALASGPREQPRWPSALDPVQRETLRILQDTVEEGYRAAQIAELKRVIEDETKAQERRRASEEQAVY
ncbi:carboxy terminal-processing peptidase [Roseibacillus ishigakijimensis]|uniref:Carboxy terminal-processing peptidase n=1 Tax=Roseibacillus ishigakijimensis TaxID=454146 RepID=A0A934VL82_9BACT|nr:carboxy terminal-processing peptidase [Roseibacillus ishigakijimensis]MBK1834409.1 carboxy terminal-processing peptidase [Roseibacillus ishigakijimensis]